MKFHLTADAQFEAHDLNDALGQLTQHFADLMGGQPDGNELDCEGHILVGPVDAPDCYEPAKQGWFRRLLAAVGWRA